MLSVVPASMRSPGPEIAVHKTVALASGLPLLENLGASHDGAGDVHTICSKRAAPAYGSGMVIRPSLAETGSSCTI